MYVVTVANAGLACKKEIVGEILAACYTLK
jgi:hypothetical protein